MERIKTTIFLSILFLGLIPLLRSCSWDEKEEESSAVKSAQTEKKQRKRSTTLPGWTKPAPRPVSSSEDWRERFWKLKRMHKRLPSGMTGWENARPIRNRKNPIRVNWDNLKSKVKSSGPIRCESAEEWTVVEIPPEAAQGFTAYALVDGSPAYGYSVRLMNGVIVHVDPEEPPKYNIGGSPRLEIRVWKPMTIVVRIFRR